MDEEQSGNLSTDAHISLLQRDDVSVGEPAHSEQDANSYEQVIGSAPVGQDVSADKELAHGEENANIFEHVVGSAPVGQDVVADKELSHVEKDANIFEHVVGSAPVGQDVVADKELAHVEKDANNFTAENLIGETGPSDTDETEAVHELNQEACIPPQATAAVTTGETEITHEIRLEACIPPQETTAAPTGESQPVHEIKLESELVTTGVHHEGIATSSHLGLDGTPVTEDSARNMTNNETESYVGAPIPDISAHTVS
jgi:hypothetical protein